MLQSGETIGTSALIAETTATGIIFSFGLDTIYFLIPYIFIIFALVILDMVEGVKASKKRGEEVRVSKMLRRTIGKIFEYFCWLVLAGFVRTASGSDWVFYLIVLLPFCIELISVITNYLYVRGKKIKGFNIWKILGGKLGLELGDIEIEDITDKEK